MTLTLSKRVPARTRTETADWCQREFLPMTPDFRRIRSSRRNPMDKCYWCGHPFDDGEMMALAAFVEKGNKTLCQSCADELLSSQEA
jgi:hypothetical protein